MCWRSDFVALQHTVLPGERLYLVETRAAVLEELAHRNPQEFPGWLYSTHVASTAAPSFTPTPQGSPTNSPNRDQPP